MASNAEHQRYSVAKALEMICMLTKKIKEKKVVATCYFFMSTIKSYKQLGHVSAVCVV